MIPSEKSPQIEKLLDSLISRQGTRKSHVENDQCVSCGDSAKSFRDDVSKREFAISGFCQKCQDETFGVS